MSPHDVDALREKARRFAGRETCQAVAQVREIVAALRQVEELRALVARCEAEPAAELITVWRGPRGPRQFVPVRSRRGRPWSALVRPLGVIDPARERMNWTKIQIAIEAAEAA